MNDEHDALLASGVDHMNVVISRVHVEAGDIGETSEALSSLTSTTNRVRHFRFHVSLLFAGYDDDPREVYEIPEIRAFVRRLNDEFPFWMWFLSPADASLRLVAACLCDVRAAHDGATGFIAPDATQFAHFITNGFDAVNNLADEHNLSDTELIVVSDVIARYFEK